MYGAWNRQRRGARVATLVIAGMGCFAFGQPAEAQTEKPVVAATVDGEPIYVGEVNVLLDSMRRVQQIGRQAEPKARADALGQLINRRLAEKALLRDGSYAKPKEVDDALDKFKSQLAAQQTTPEQYAAKLNVGTDMLRHQMAWSLIWPAYLDRHLADAIEGYFKAHKQEFDGTQLRASHILLRAERQGETNAQIVARAEKLRADIVSGKISFAEAAKRYSAGPSRHEAGDVGLFPRNGVMAEEFAKAAFSLKPEEISKPVETNYGVHLIQVTEVQPGQRQWTEVVDQIKTAASVDLFYKVVEPEREGAKIEFTGRAPYLKPGTGELVVPPAG